MKQDNQTAKVFAMHGNAEILNRQKIALFCSVKCPGKLILETYDLAKRFREEGITVISGFHSPMEQECLQILLRSTTPVIWCLARGMLKSVPSELRTAVNEGRLLIVSPFPDTVSRVTAKTAIIRNRLVADLADAVVVAHASAGSKMEGLCRELLVDGKRIYTFDHPGNADLIIAGAQFRSSGMDIKEYFRRSCSGSERWAKVKPDCGIFKSMDNSGT